MCKVRSGARIVGEALIREGVDTVLGIPGGAIMPFYHARSGAFPRAWIAESQEGDALFRQGAA